LEFLVRSCGGGTKGSDEIEIFGGIFQFFRALGEISSGDFESMFLVFDV